MEFSKGILSKKELKELKEEEEKKKALKYFTASMIDKQEAKEQAEFKEKADKACTAFYSFIKKELFDELPRIVNEAEHLLEYLNSAKKHKNDFFKIDFDAPEHAELKDNLKKLNLKKSDFYTLAFCATGKKIKRLAHHINKRCATKPEDINELSITKKDSIEKAKEIISEFAKSNSKKYAKLLYEGLKNCCEQFSNEKITSEEAMEWSGYAQDMLHLLKRDPKLVELSGITEKQLGVANTVASMGESIVNGMKQVEVLVDLQKSKIELGDKEKQAINDQILEMKLALFSRSKLIREWDDPVEVQPSLGK